MKKENGKRPTRIQQKNRELIMEAALEVFSKFGFRGSTLDQVAEQAGLSKPNILYYFKGKEEMHRLLLDRILEPMRAECSEGNAESADNGGDE